MKIRFILALLSLGLFEISLFGHDQIVHQAITAKAVEAAYGNSPAFAGFINVISFDGRLLSDAKLSIVNGSYDEDNAGVDVNGNKDIGGNRSYNHFYDPLNMSGPLASEVATFGAVSSCARIEMRSVCLLDSVEPVG